MKNVKHILAAVVLSLSLSASALAGDIYGVGAPAPPPAAEQPATQNVSSTQQTTTSEDASAASDGTTSAVVEAALGVLNTVLALF
jgi:hypothetical protein